MLRRSFLKTAGALPFVLAWDRAGAVEPPRIPIGELEVFHFPVNHRGGWTILRLHAEGGLTGLGDASHAGRDEETMAWLKRFAALLRGRSIFDVEWFRATTSPLVAKAVGASAAVAASALEHCLWDLIGRKLEIPVYDLFGGRIRDSVHLYANINRSANPRSPAGFADMARRATADGLDAIKLAPFDEIPAGLPAGLERTARRAGRRKCRGSAPSDRPRPRAAGRRA